jgi:hypothetical protein
MVSLIAWTGVRRTESQQDQAQRQMRFHGCSSINNPVIVGCVVGEGFERAGNICNSMSGK